MRDLEQLALLLEETRARMQDRVSRLEVSLEALTAARRSESDDDEHDPEGVPLSAEWSRLTGLIESAREDLRQADLAHERLDAGTYGVCIDCEKPIPTARLEARPFADRCVPCASKRSE